MNDTTLKPVTVSGWYERRDGTIGYYQWRNGQVELLRSVANWPAVEEWERRAERAEAEL